MKLYYSKIGHAIALFSLLLLISCEDQIVNQCCEEEQNSTVRLSTLSSIQKNVFNGSCATAGCHSGSSPAANLNLESGQSFSNLVNIGAILHPNQKRVKPFDSQNSILVLSLRGAISTKMPLGSPQLSSSVVDSIAVWIDEGAQNN